MFKKVKIFFLVTLVVSFMFSISVNANTREAYQISTNPGEDMSTMMNIRYHSDIEDTFVEYTLFEDTTYQNSEIAQGVCTPWSMPVQIEGGFLSSGFAERLVCDGNLVGLMPDTQYRYRVGKTNMSEDYSFITAKPRGESGFSFLHITDPQYGTEADSHIFNNLISKALEIDPEIRFGFFTGDIVDRGGREEQWNWFFARSNIRNLPIAAGVGNHEYYDNSGTPKIQSAEYFNAHFNNPSNGHPTLMNSTYYFHYNNTLFIMIDTEFQGYASQVSWFREVMEREAAQFVVVGMHKSFYGGQYASQGLGVRNTWRRVFEDYNVDLVLSGHDHIYARSLPMYQDKPTTNPQLGITYIIGGVGGRKFYSVDPSPTSNTQFYDHYVENTSVANIITIDHEKISIELIDLYGNVLDTATLPAKRPVTTMQNIDKDAFMNQIAFYTYETDMRQGQIVWPKNSYPDVSRIRVFRNDTDSVAISTTYIINNNLDRATFFGLREGQDHNTKIEVLFRDGTIKERIVSYTHKKPYGELSGVASGEITKDSAQITWDTAFLNSQVKHIQIKLADEIIEVLSKDAASVVLVDLESDTEYTFVIEVVDIFDDVVQSENITIQTEEEVIEEEPVEDVPQRGCKKATAMWMSILALGFLLIFRRKKIL